MKDYRDDHSPDIALLLTVADVTRRLLGMLPAHTAIAPEPMMMALDAAMKPFEHYPNPVETETEETGA
jgi:hypothetical protein